MENNLLAMASGEISLGIGESQVSEIIDYMGQLFSEMLPILSLVFGIFIGLLVIGFIFSTLKK